MCVCVCVCVCVCRLPYHQLFSLKLLGKIDPVSFLRSLPHLSEPTDLDHALDDDGQHPEQDNDSLERVSP